MNITLKFSEFPTQILWIDHTLPSQNEFAHTYVSVKHLTTSCLLSNHRSCMGWKRQLHHIALQEMCASLLEGDGEKIFKTQ